MTVQVNYLGMMRLEVADWDGSAKVVWEQKSGATALKSGSQEITALPGEVVITNDNGTLRWPFEGRPDAQHKVNIPQLLPSQLAINWLRLLSSPRFSSSANFSKVIAPRSGWWRPTFVSL